MMALLGAAAAPSVTGPMPELWITWVVVWMGIVCAAWLDGIDG